MEMTGAQILMETLLEQGTDVIFGYPGGTVLDLPKRGTDSSCIALP